MIKKCRKHFKNRKVNQGNTFIMVVATISFLAVLVAALLVAVALCYRLKAYDINARDNFYYLEQAMDEIYAGVGADAMQNLNQAYDETLEVLVYYDAKSKSYVTMKNEDANKLLKDSFMNLMYQDDNYKLANVGKTLSSFLSNQYDAGSNPYGVKLDVSSTTVQQNKTEGNMTITHVVLTREAPYSTINARTAANGKTVGAKDTFIQSITTDLVVAKPDFDVNFNSISADLNELYSFSLIADMGIEITGKPNAAGKTTTALGKGVNITGNIYAASDFYNKDYDENKVDKTKLPSSLKKDQIQKVSAYKDTEARYKACDGVQAKSMYSGIYIDGADVVLASDKIIVPGTIAAMNCAKLSVSSLDDSSIGMADLWADNIVLGGYSLRKTTDGKTMKGASVDLKANAYVSDDLEINANSAELSLNGQYYGYNYASKDNRTFASSVTTANGRSFSSSVADGVTDGVGIDGQAHYNSSSIILNGENASLDFQYVTSLYVAGQSYIEVSKEKSESKDVQTITYTAETTDENGKTKLEQVSDDVADELANYPTIKTDKDKAGKDLEDDAYSVAADANGKVTSDATAVQDYRTGEAISVKSNQLAYQLAYIPNAQITDQNGELYVSLPESIRNLDAYKGVWDDLAKVPIIKSVISGNTYYFFDFSKAKDTAAMNTFIANYAELFAPVTGADDEVTIGEASGLINIADYDYFKVKMLQLYNTASQTGSNPYANIYTNSAITTVGSKSFTIKADSKSIAPLVQAAKNINAANKEGNRNAAVSESESQDPAVLASAVTTQLQNQYKEMKWLLTNQSTDSTGVAEAHDMQESVLTPINHYFDFAKITGSMSHFYGLNSGYGVWISDGDVEIGKDKCTIDGHDYKYDKVSFSNGKAIGLVIAKGDVTFADDVTDFEGMIVAGGKIIVNNFTATKNNMNFLANEEIIKTILRECDSRQGENKEYGQICEIFRLFESQYKPPTTSDETEVESMKSISAVQFEDILMFENWMKNVD